MCIYKLLCRACKCTRIYVGMKDDAAANPVVVAKFWLDLTEPHNVVPCCIVKSNMIMNCEKDGLLYINKMENEMIDTVNKHIF